MSFRSKRSQTTPRSYKPRLFSHQLSANSGSPPASVCENAPRMTMSRRTVGQYGERLAEHYLMEIGARLLACNFRIAYGEIDLVVEHEGELVAVEVKTRTIDELTQPEEAVSWRKLRCIVQALTTYALDNELMEMPWRIDVVAIELELDGRVHRLDHLRSVYPA
jgi:putative endonuclease